MFVVESVRLSVLLIQFFGVPAMKVFSFWVDETGNQCSSWLDIVLHLQPIVLLIGGHGNHTQARGYATCFRVHSGSKQLVWSCVGCHMWRQIFLLYVDGGNDVTELGVRDLPGASCVVDCTNYQSCTVYLWRYFRFIYPLFFIPSFSVLWILAYTS